MFERQTMTDDDKQKETMGERIARAIMKTDIRKDCRVRFIWNDEVFDSVCHQFNIDRIYRVNKVINAEVSLSHEDELLLENLENEIVGRVPRRFVVKI